MHARPYSVICRTNCTPSETGPLVYTYPRYYTGWLWTLWKRVFLRDVLTKWTRARLLLQVAYRAYASISSIVVSVQYLRYRSNTPLEVGTVRDFWVLKGQGTHDFTGFGRPPFLHRV